MAKKFLHAHRYKLIIGAPVIFLLLINTTGIVGQGNVFLLDTEKSAFVEIGDEFGVILSVSTKAPVNAVGGILTYPPELLSLASLSRKTSIIDLWSEEPTFSDGTIGFSGGIIDPENTLQKGVIFSVDLKAMKPGKAALTIRNGQLLAANGEGTNVLSGAGVLSIYIREPGTPSPDVNGDNTLSISDINSLYLKTYRSYDAAYDMNQDGKVNWADVRLLIALF